MTHMKIVASASQYAIDSAYSQLHKREVRYVWEIEVLSDVVAYVTASKRVGNVGEVWETRYSGAGCSHFTQTQVTFSPLLGSSMPGSHCIRPNIRPK